MRYIIVTGGPLPDDAADLIRSLSEETEDKDLIACDGGCDILARHNIVPDLVVGDMDSISDKGLEFIKSNDVFVETYPVEKDWTDTEIALGKAEDGEIFLVTPFSGRPDHTLANYQLILNLRSKGRKIVMTDGITYCYPLFGEDSVKIDLKPLKKPVAVSLVPWNFGEEVKGVTTKGLYYALDNADLTAGSSFSFSNHPVDENARIAVEIKAGRLLVIATIAD